MSLYQGGIRSVAWWVTAAVGVVVLALILSGELDQGTADWFTYVYLVWMAAWTAIGLFVWAVRPYLRLTGPLWAWSGILHLNDNFVYATPDSKFLVTETLLLTRPGRRLFIHWALAYPRAGCTAHLPFPTWRSVTSAARSRTSRTSCRTRPRTSTRQTSRGTYRRSRRTTESS